VPSRSALFIIPDYHCSFILRDELRRLGWVSDIYVPSDFPERFLYESTGVYKARSSRKTGKISEKLIGAFNFFYLMRLGLKYKYHIHYGRLTHPAFIEKY
jgi:hypothetical protein